MFYHNITHDDMNNGEGIRVVLWVSGCEHRCSECHNRETWSYQSGINFDNKALTELYDEMNKDYVTGVTFSGGDPLAPRNREFVEHILTWLKKCFPNKNVWVYTGYKYEQLVFEGNHYVVSILHNTDVLVDGRYMKNLRDTNLKWRGSKNQRVIDVQKSLEKGEVVLHCD